MMENMQYAEELVREFLVFRGFTSTLQSFEKELNTDIGKGFQLDNILDLIFSVYIPKFQAENLVALLTFFKQCFSSSEIILTATLSRLEISVLQYYIVHALQSGRKDKVIEFFGMNGNELMQRNKDWTSWFAIPYLENPSLDPRFRVYFTKEWFEAFYLSVRNFLSEIFNGTRIPALLKISLEKNAVNRLKNDIKHLNSKLSQLQALLEEKEAQLCQLRSNVSTAVKASAGTNGSTSFVPRIAVSSAHKEATTVPSKDVSESPASANRYISETAPVEDKDVTTSAETSGASPEMSSHVGTSVGMDRSSVETDEELLQEEDFPEVKINFQETFLGHTSPISRCRFSTSGDNIASASVDGTVSVSQLWLCGI